MSNNKMFSRYFSIAAIALVIIAAALLVGCTAKENTNNVDNSGDNNKTNAAIQEETQNKLMSDFDVLMKSSPKADAVIAFIDQNISKASRENASDMLFRLEELQKKELPKLEEKYYSDDKIQLEMQKIYQPGFDLKDLDKIQDPELKDLLSETKAMGYKVETAEGMFFPFMNYENYKKYSDYVTADAKEYIELMAVETNKTPIKDAALMIGWDEIIKRALAQEQFIKNYESSAKMNEVKELQKRYITFMLYGANNTPLFSYDTKVMTPEAKSAYTNAVQNYKDSEMLKILGQYMDILNKTDYKFSYEADKFRKAVLESK